MNDRPSDMPPTAPASRRNQTMAYSIVDLNKRLSVLDVKTIIASLLEKDIDAWKKMPQSVKDLMLASPEKFNLILSPHKDGTPKIVYGGVVLAYNPAWGWILDSIEP